MTEINEDDELLISKSALKREAAAFLELAATLVKLPKKQLSEVPLNSTQRDAIDLARRLDNDNARKRQMRYIAKQLKDNADQIQATLEKFTQQNQLFRQHITAIEQWCLQLIEGDQALLEQLLADYPLLARQQLRQLVRQAQKNAATGKNQQPAKKLFSYLQKHAC